MTEPAGGDTGGRRARFNLLDASALVVGYGLASLLVRAYWPGSGDATAVAVGLIGLVFAWLGLAMSGPVVLLIRRPAPVAPGEDERPGARTWAELAWMVIGFYWIGLAVLVVPARVDGARLLDSAVLGVFPVAAALALRWFRPARAWAGPGPGEGPGAWTHRAGVALLITWPFAWVALIALGKILL